jgi:hypothetical protein
MKNELLIMMLLLALIAGYVVSAAFDRGPGKKLKRRSRLRKKTVNPVTDMPDQPFQGVPADKPPAPFSPKENWPPEQDPAADWVENGGVLNCEENSPAPPKE